VTERLIYYDGLCGLCDRFVWFVVRRDKSLRYQFAPLQGSTARDRLSGKLDLNEMKTVVLDEGGGLRVRSDAALTILSGLGGLGKLVAIFRVVPRPIRDAIYDWIARNRHRWFGRRDSCRLPTPAEQSRFLP
jgi:predicted DCC family thiol-disulfide oxidoreductase YuxK